MGIAYFAPLVFTLGFYMLTNQLYFGSAMPVSGKIKRWWGTLKYTVYGKPPKNIPEFLEEFFSSSDSVGPWSIVMSPLQDISSWLRGLESGSKIIWGVVFFAFMILLIFALIRNRGFVAAAFWRGNLIPLLRSCQLPLSFVTNGQNVPDDIEPADRRRLTRAMLNLQQQP